MEIFLIILLYKLAWAPTFDFIRRGSNFKIKIKHHMLSKPFVQYTLFYKEPTLRPSSKSSLFVDLKSANCSIKSSLIVP